MQAALLRIEEARLGGVDARPWREPLDVELEERSQLIQGYVNKQLPLRMRVVLAVRGNAVQPGGTLSQLDYEVRLDEKLLGQGQVAPNMALPAEGTTVELPLAFEFNTRKYLGDDALPALRNFAVGLADRRRRPLRLGLRLRPTVVSADGHATRSPAFVQVAADTAGFFTAPGPSFVRKP